MNEPAKDAPKVMMLPPTLVLTHLAAGIVLNWAVPFSLSPVWGWLGLLLLAAAVGTIQWSRTLFQKAGTNVPPNQPTLVIVREGPYKFTRNPMYLSFVAGFVGLSFLSGGLMMLLLALPLFFLLDQRVIAPEEAYLTEKFGDAYRDYMKQVRRWL